MRILTAASAATATGLIAAGMLGVAGAETTTTTTASAPTPPLRTVSVQGVASEAIEQSASAAAATAVYRQGLTDAVNDGQSKAQFLASKAGATLGTVQSMTEEGGSIYCAGEGGYQGQQPDFGYSRGSGLVGVAAPAARPVTAHKQAAPSRRHRKRHPAKKASAETCTLSTQVSLVYAMN
jgi:hypothetical protein